MAILDHTAIAAMPKRQRVQLATSLPGIKPIALVGTIDPEGQTNLAPFSSLVHLGSNPLLIGMITRPDTVDRHTLSNLQRNGSYTLNHLTPDLVDRAHHCSARYPREVSEFDATGLTPHFETGIPAPFVAESPFRLGLELRELIDITANQTKLIVGEVIHVELPDDALAEDGTIDFEAIDQVASSALDSYFTVRLLGRLAYAKPKPPHD